MLHSSAFFLCFLLFPYAALQSIKGQVEKYGPIFEEQPQNILFPEGSAEEQVTLSCRARAIPPANYRWKLNGTDLNLAENSSYHLFGGNLAISNPTHSKHVGTYQCVASNTLGTVLSNEASLRFGYLHEFSPEEQDQVKTTEGQGIMLPCNPPQHYPGLSYRWLLNEFPNFLANDSRHFVSQVTGNLYIARIEAKDEGKYSCLSTSHIAFTTKSVYSSFTPLIVTPVVEPRLYAPSIKVRFPVETYTLLRQSVTLECFAFGNPVPSIRWRKVDTSQPPQWFASDPVLHIKSISFDDDGTYECEAKNSMGQDIHQGRVIVQDVEEGQRRTLFLDVTPWRRVCRQISSWPPCPCPPPLPLPPPHPHPLPNPLPHPHPLGYPPLQRWAPPQKRSSRCQAPVIPPGLSCSHSHGCNWVPGWVWAPGHRLGCPKLLLFWGGDPSMGARPGSLSGRPPPSPPSPPPPGGGRGGWQVSSH